MRRHTITRTVAALGLALAVAVAGCQGCAAPGTVARNEALLPALAAQWPQVLGEVELGLQADAGLNERQRVDLRVAATDWTTAFAEPTVDRVLDLRDRDWDAWMHVAAHAGVDERLARGQIGQHGANTAHESLDWFDRGLAALAGEPTDPE